MFFSLRRGDEERTPTPNLTFELRHGEMTECYVGTARVSTKRALFSLSLANSGLSCCSPKFPLFARTTSL